jgi:hypothetical protein
MSTSLKRLQKIEAALEQLLAKEKAYLVFYRGNDPKAELQWHIDVGNFDPARQEAVIIMAWGPRPRPDPKTYRKGWTSELPQARKRNMAAEIISEVNELPKYGGPDPSGPCTGAKARATSAHQVPRHGHSLNWCGRAAATGADLADHTSYCAR